MNTAVPLLHTCMYTCMRMLLCLHTRVIRCTPSSMSSMIIQCVITLSFITGAQSDNHYHFISGRQCSSSGLCLQHCSFTHLAAHCWRTVPPSTFHDYVSSQAHVLQVMINDRAYELRDCSTSLHGTTPAVMTTRNETIVHIMMLVVHHSSVGSWQRSQLEASQFQALLVLVGVSSFRLALPGVPGVKSYDWP